MSHHHYEGPKDKTNPLMYVPVVIIAVALVVVVFVSGVLRGIYAGKMSDKTAVASTAGAEAINVRALAQPTDELIQQGRQIYSINCASCHGAEGLGNGAKGAELNPPPRNFTVPAEQWTNGPTLGGIWETLDNGIPGTSMSAYSLLPGDERIALVHYVRDAFVTDPPEPTPEEIAALPGPTNAAGSGVIVEVAPVEPEGPTIPVELAMEKMTTPQYDVRPVTYEVPAFIEQLPGHALYGSYCAECHGASGSGNPATRVLTVHPYMRLAVPPFSAMDQQEIQQIDEFARKVTQSTPGTKIHGFGTLTTGQVELLHEYVVALSGQGEGN